MNAMNGWRTVEMHLTFVRLPSGRVVRLAGATAIAQNIGLPSHCAQDALGNGAAG